MLVTITQLAHATALLLTNHVFFCAKWLIQHASPALSMTAGFLVICIIIGVLLPESAIDIDAGGILPGWYLATTFKRKRRGRSVRRRHS